MAEQKTIAPASIYYRLKVILAQDGVGRLVWHIVLINALFSGLLLVVGWFIDFAAVYRHFSIMTMAQYQSLNIFGALVAEILITVLVVLEWLYRRHFSNASTERMLAEGEHESLEFKSSLRWDFKLKQVNKDLEHSILKSIAGFMNARGGTLFIGVDDKGEPLGLDEDMQTLRKKDADGFVLHLGQLITDTLGASSGAYVAARVMRIATKSICRVDVLPSRRPIYLEHSGGRQEFFVRIAASTKELQVKEAHEYITLHWGS